MIAVMEMRHRGISLHRIRPMMNVLHRVADVNAQDQYLISNRKGLRSIRGEGAVIDYMKHSKEPLLLFSLPDMIRRIEVSR